MPSKVTIYRLSEYVQCVVCCRLKSRRVTVYISNKVVLWYLFYTNAVTSSTFRQAANNLLKNTLLNKNIKRVDSQGVCFSRVGRLLLYKYTCEINQTVVYPGEVSLLGTSLLVPKWLSALHFTYSMLYIMASLMCLFVSRGGIIFIYLFSSLFFSIKYMFYNMWIN